MRLQAQPTRLTSNIEAELGSHRITLDGGFAVVFDQDRKMLASFQEPAESSPASLEPWLETEPRAASLHGSLSEILFNSAQRGEENLLRVGGQEYALGMAATASGKVVIAALPVPQGVSQTMARIRSGAQEYRQLYRARNRLRTTFILMLLLITVFVFFSSVWLALFLSKQITRPVEALADAMNEIAEGKYEHRVSTPGYGGDG